MRLADKHCVPCRGGVPPLTDREVKPLLAELPEWDLHRGHLYRWFHFANFVDAVKFVDEITEVAEAEGHHPDLFVTWAKVAAEIWTHKIDGLTESDFILGAKLDRLYAGRNTPVP